MPLLSSNIKLGVTGLARSGKTVFITALIENLLHGGRLPFFDAVAQHRIKRVYLVPQPDDSIPRFPFERHLDAITGPERSWPESTNRISQLRLAIEFETGEFLWRQLGDWTLYIDIIDYPGEWLLDLPLLELSFEEWCAQSLEMAQMPERKALSLKWLEFISQLDPNASWDERVVEQAASSFKDYLVACRSKDHALSTVPPGRFLMPGDMEGSPALTFSPLIPAQDGQKNQGELWDQMASRYEAYKKHVVKPFFQNHFSQLDRQIILVDALHVINAGADAVRDMQRALQQILKCFNTGGNSWLNRIWNKRIDRLVFAATKADQLHHASHDRLSNIMTMLTEDAVHRAQYSGAQINAMAMASVRSTREGEVRQGEDVLPCIIGVPAKGAEMNGQIFDGSRELAVFPGDLPEDPAELLKQVTDQSGNKEDSQDLLQFIDFRPPEITAANQRRPLPNIRLDRAMNFLLGDKLQ